MLRTVLSGGALSVTHFADTRMQGILRRRIVERLGRVPLGWFTQHSSGLVRKATQNDINDIHYLVAHGAVETTAAITVPLAGLALLARFTEGLVTGWLVSHPPGTVQTGCGLAGSPGSLPPVAVTRLSTLVVALAATVAV